eukprot:6214160-Pleurochrysis_carterae.AAC.3
MSSLKGKISICTLLAVLCRAFVCVFARIRVRVRVRERERERVRRVYLVCASGPRALCVQRLGRRLDVDESDACVHSASVPLTKPG